MKKVAISALIVIIIVCACLYKGNAQKDDAIVLRFAYASNGDVVIDSMKMFGDLVAEKTNGEVVVEYYPDGQIGGERESIELTQTGAIDITKVSGSALESFSPIYSIFGVPYIFDDVDHFYRVMESPEIREQVFDSTKDLGFVAIDYYDSGQRSFYTKDKPILVPDDLKGLKIRVMQSATAIRMVELLGGSPTPMSSSEVYVSLQSGVLDGAENNEFALTDARHAEVAKVYSYDSHTRVPDIIIMNSETLSSLSEEHQKAIYEAIAESREYEKEAFQGAIDDAKKRCVDEFGMTFYDEEVQVELFREAVAPIHDDVKNNEQLKSVYELIGSLSNQ